MNTAANEDISGPVRLEGPLDLYSAEAVRDRLLLALDGAAALEVDLGAVTACDAAGVQLLLAARATAAARGWPLTFRTVPAVVADRCTRLGLAGLGNDEMDKIRR